MLKKYFNLVIHLKVDIMRHHEVVIIKFVYNNNFFVYSVLLLKGDESVELSLSKDERKFGFIPSKTFDAMMAIGTK